MDISSEVVDTLGRRTGPRQMHTIEEKRRIVEETHVRGVSVAIVARRHEVNANPGVLVWLAAGATDMRKGFDGLSALVQTQLAKDAFSGQLFVFRGRAGDRVKILWWSGDGLCLFAKRLERGRFVWPQATHGTVALSGAQLSMLLEGIDWRRPIRTTDPQLSA